MKKKFLVTLLVVLSIAEVNSQVRQVVKKDQPVTLKVTNTAVVKNFKTTPISMGTYADVTPTTMAPEDAVKNSVSLYTNPAGNATSDNEATKYYMFDNTNDGKDKLLSIQTNTLTNSLRKIDRNSAGNVAPVGGFQFLSVINNYDELLFGEFSSEPGATILLVDRRVNQFWHYQRNPSNFMIFQSPYSMLSNWPPADRYATGDFNGDGKTDLLGWNLGRNEFQVALHTKNASSPTGAATLQPAGVWLSGWAQSNEVNMVIGDFNGDKKDDIALVHQPTGEWWVALSTGTAFQASNGYKSGVWLKPWAVGAHHKIAALDVNGDGFCDLVEYNTLEKSFQAVLSNGQFFDYFFKREFVTNSISNPEQVTIGQFGSNCMLAISHVLSPDNYYVQPRRTVSIYLTSYKR